MKPVVKLNLAVLGLSLIYFVIRLLGISGLPLSLWQQVYLGNFVKNSFLLFLALILTYSVFNSIRLNPRLGPTIVTSKALKRLLFLFLGLTWLAVSIHTVFDSFKIVVPFKFLPFYQFSDLMDETIAHIFIYLSVIGIVFVASLLEIERPSSQPLSRRETLFIILTNIVIGVIWGLNLSEGRLALITSLPAMVIYLLLIFFLKRKYPFSFRLHPWSLFSTVTAASATLSLTIWALSFHSVPELFTVLQ